MCAIQKHKQNLIIVSMMRRKITSHKRRRHHLRLLRRRKALKLKLLLKKIMMIMHRRMAARRRQLTPKVNKILDKATQMSKELGHSTPKLVKQIQDGKIVSSKESAKVKDIDAMTIPSETLEKLLKIKEITKEDANKLGKLDREGLLNLIKPREFQFIKNNIIPENLVLKIVKRLRKMEKKDVTKIVKSPEATPVSLSVPSSPNSSSPTISSPSSASSVSSPSSASPIISITDTKSATPSISSKPTIVFPRK